jgi:predicted naringenin-chalcone synthase
MSNQLPDPGFLLIQKLGLNNTTERISVNMMGCFGGLTTIKTAKAMALQNPKNRVLIVCTEVCSIHSRPTLHVDTMLGCALFADGSGAMIIGCNPTENEQPLFEIIQTGAFHIPDTLHLMNWNLNSDGWHLGLSPLIPIAFGKTVVEIVDTFLRNSVPFPVSLDECDWLMHPGGKNILLSVQNALNIPTEKNISSWNVLRDYGNMSSATILFVMDDARKSTSKEKFSVAVAFGPGLSVEITLMRKL